AIQRHKDGMNIKNGLLWEISNIYQEEYAIGKKALEIIEAHTSIQLPDDEAGFIAHHIVNAALNEEMTNVVNITRSEEHTSELQSRFDLVCRLLLEKKNN